METDWECFHCGAWSPENGTSRWTRVGGRPVGVHFDDCIVLTFSSVLADLSTCLIEKEND